MKYRRTGKYEKIASYTSLVPFSREYDVDKFNCGIEDYNLFLKNDTEYYINNNISSVSMLIHNETKEIIGYIALLADAFLLDKDEKRQLMLDIPFSSVPALKIGKLAVSLNHKNHCYGSFLLEICLGYAQKMVESGIACRFLTVDADIEFNEKTPDFYESNGFVRNEHKQLKNRKKLVSMRYDLFEE